MHLNIYWSYSHNLKSLITFWKIKLFQQMLFLLEFSSISPKQEVSEIDGNFYWSFSHNLKSLVTFWKIKLFQQMLFYYFAEKGSMRNWWKFQVSEWTEEVQSVEFGLEISTFWMFSVRQHFDIQKLIFGLCSNVKIVFCQNSILTFRTWSSASARMSKNKTKQNRNNMISGLFSNSRMPK